MNLPAGAVLLEPPMVEWYCPNCPVVDRTKATVPNRFHRCHGPRQLAGLTAPLLRKGVAAKVEAVEREDYVGRDRVQLHQGRPVMSVVTTRDTGQDTVVFAPTALAAVR